MKLQKRKIALIIGIFLLIVVVVVATAGFTVFRIVTQAKTGDFSGIKSVQKLGNFASTATFHKIPLIESVKYCSAVAEIQEKILATKNLQYEVVPFNLDELNKVVDLEQNNISKCLDSASKSKLVRSFLPRDFFDLLPDVATTFSDIKTILEELAERDQTWLVLFQNSDELRATGGFTGSYALVSFNEGQVSEIVFEDIYDADGQFRGFVEPPSGVKEFLSSANGLRLPDANWHPDNLKSVQQQLDFFALGQKQNIDGVAVVNLPFAEKLLKITGPVEIPDYDIVISDLNLHQALRDERDEFFAGSIQKKHILSQVVKQTLFKVNQFGLKDYLSLSKLIQNGVLQKEIMFYGRDAKIANIIDKYDASGAIKVDDSAYFLGLIESNVGINKANRSVNTTIFVDLHERRSQIKIDISNNNPSNSGKGYVNYQRVLIAPEWQVHELSVNGEVIQNWDEEMISTSSDKKLKQIGFLITTPEQNQSLAVIEISHPPLVIPGNLQIFKQPGQAPVPYVITHGDQQIHLLLESNQVVVLE